MAHDAAAEAERALKNTSHDGILGGEDQLRLAQVYATLAVAQNLSQIHHNGIAPEYDPAI